MSISTVTNNSNLSTQIIIYLNSNLPLLISPDQKIVRDLHAPGYSLHSPNSECPKQPLPNLFGSLHETANEVRGHEQHGVLLVVHVVPAPEGPALGVEGGEELFHRALKIRYYYIL